jgi:Zn-dependent M28 family amino/carboxypeptidase
MTDWRQVLETVSIDRIRHHIRLLEGVRHPVAAPEALEKAACYIRESLQALGCEMSEQLFSDGGRDYANIIATLRGTRFPEERVIVLAHYDTVETTPGADDNASGIALVLELATLFAPYEFERSLQFIAVNLEEHARCGDLLSPSLRGSRALAEHARAAGWDIAGVVVLESVAYAGDDVVQTAPAGIPFPVPETGNFIAVIGNGVSQRLVEGFVQAIERQDIPLPCLPLAVSGNGEMLPDTRRSDHAPFWDNGYPAVMVTDTTNFRSPHYHQPGDRLVTLNLRFAADVCRAAGGLVAALAGHGGRS